MDNTAHPVCVYTAKWGKRGQCNRPVLVELVSMCELAKIITVVTEWVTYHCTEDSFTVCSQQKSNNLIGMYT